jgi:hypothetical protein
MRRLGIPTRRPGPEREFHFDPDWLYREYVVKERTAPEIAKEVGCSSTTVYDALERHGI